VADAEFRWNTFANNQISHSEMKGTTLVIKPSTPRDRIRSFGITRPDSG
jgi:hypothetical protein